MPIRGIRWRCVNCADYDMCSDCEATFSHTKTHIFYKIRIPVPYGCLPKQQPVYPGRFHLEYKSLPLTLRKRLVQETSMEAEKIDSLYEQFTCLAATKWEHDTNDVGWAIDRRNFNHAFVPQFTGFDSAPNLIYDRTFAYFDSDHNDLIGLEEFIKGLDGLHTTKPGVKLRIAFNGYDVDGDGYISRKDVLRIFRAHYVIEREATRNHLIQAEDDLDVHSALDTIHSSQPLGSAFTQAVVPVLQPNTERLRNKTPGPPIAEDDPDTMTRNEIIRQTYPMANRDYRVQSGEEAVRSRWALRNYYIDEEEGFTRPRDASYVVTDELEIQTDGHIDELKTERNRDSNEHPALVQEHPRGSRSSSHVRSQVDSDQETHSNAPTSSRPIVASLGGYEIPEPEKDLGKDVLYQITQQAFNELLDPLFKDKEENTIDVFTTRAKRRSCAVQIDRILDDFQKEKDFNRTVVEIEEHRYASEVIEAFCDGDIMSMIRNDSSDVKNAGSSISRDHLEAAARSLFSRAEQRVVTERKTWSDDYQAVGLPMWNAKLYRIQLAEELVNMVVVLAEELGWRDKTTYRDPTLPQFRPNSIADNMEWGELSIEGDGRSNTLYFRPCFALIFAGIKDWRLLEPLAPGAREPEASPPSSPSASPAFWLPPNTRRRSLTNPNDESRIEFLYIDPVSRKLRTKLGRNQTLISGLEPVAKRIRQQARSKPLSPLHLPFLASLVEVERENSERKGSGLISYDEFEAGLSGENARYLESWMDWISF
jgi:Ca2+-binding EF-hand superfamily protein